MAHISVSRESVVGVREAICAFQSDVESATVHMRNHGDQLAEEIHQSIRRQKERVNEFKEKLKALETSINQCESRLTFLKKEQAEVRCQIDRLNAEAQNLNREIHYLEQQRATASRNNNADVINQCTRQIIASERQISSIQIKSNRQKKAYESMQREDSDLCSHLRTMEEQREKVSASLKRSEHKYEHMKSAGDTAIFQIERLLDCVSSFQTQVISSSASNLSGIDCCLSAIDEYINTNL